MISGDRPKQNKIDFNSIKIYEDFRTHIFSLPIDEFKQAIDVLGGRRLSELFPHVFALIDCMDKIDDLKAPVLLRALGGRLIELLNSGALRNGAIVEILGDSKSKILLEVLGNKLSEVIKSDDVLAAWLSNLNEENQGLLLNFLRDKLGGIVKHSHYLADCLSKLNTPNQIFLLMSLGEHLSEIVHAPTCSLFESMTMLKTDAQVVLLDVMGSQKLNAIIVDGWGLSERLSKMRISTQLVLLKALRGTLNEYFVRDRTAFDSCLRALFNTGAIMSGLYIDHPAAGKREYYDYLDDNIFSGIRNEILRLHDDGAVEKAQEVMFAAMEMRSNVIAAVDRNLEPDAMKLAIHDVMKTEFTRLSEAGCVRHYRNPVAAFFKALLGVLLSAPLLFAPLAFKGYRDTFFATTAEKSLKAMTESLQENHPAIQLA